MFLSDQYVDDQCHNLYNHINIIVTSIIMINILVISIIIISVIVTVSL